MLRNLFPIIVALAAMAPAFSFAESPQSTTGISKSAPASGPSVKVDVGFMVPYTATIPGTDVTIDMVPVPGGKLQMGSPENEEDRNDDEGPQFIVNVQPMWVAKTETTWAQYKEYMRLYAIFKDFEVNEVRQVNEANKVDAITAPTELYDSSFTYEYGEEPEKPAVTMTQYAAQQYTKWLSGVTGIQYRLPTEAEWEYAARAGTKTAYIWGDDEAGIDDHAWYFDNSDAGPSPVGQKQPNRFGLFDMIGNAAEWTINRYTDDYSEYESEKSILATEVVRYPEGTKPNVIRGGSWEMNSDQLRSAARMQSDDEEWKDGDPNFPLSPWWFAADPARGVGFRIFRSYQPLGDEKIRKFWDTTSEDVQNDVQSRIEVGRGGYGLVDPQLPDAMKEAE